MRLKKINLTAIRLLLFLKDVDIVKALVSNKISFVEKNYKYFFVYLHNDSRVKLLHKMLPKTSTYVQSYNRQTKWMYSLIKDDELLEKYNTIWNKVSADIKKNLIASLSTIKKPLKSKINSHGDEVTDFYDKKIPTVDSNHICLVVISLGCALKK